MAREKEEEGLFASGCLSLLLQPEQLFLGDCWQSLLLFTLNRCPLAIAMLHLMPCIAQQLGIASTEPFKLVITSSIFEDNCKDILDELESIGLESTGQNDPQCR